MFQFVGYHPLGGDGALSQAPAYLTTINTIELKNGIFDHFNMTKNINTEYNPSIPTEWDYDTILNADFEGDLVAGNIDIAISKISAIKIKRRIKGTFDWLTLKSIPITSVDDISFVFNDCLNAFGVEYEYAFVPIMENTEGTYIINSIESKFNGVFIGDFEQTFRFLYDVNYGSNSRVQQIGTFQPLGSKYPVVVANGDLSYDTGSVSGLILNDSFDDTKEIVPTEITKKKEKLKDFLTDKKPKCLKDWAGNRFLCLITESPTISYVENAGLRVPRISFGWTQIGDIDNQQDLYDSGMVREV